MNLDLLAKIKERGRAQAVHDSRKMSDVDVAMMKSDVLQRLFDNKETCGSCTRWRTCTKLHRSGHVSPMFRACLQYQFDFERVY